MSTKYLIPLALMGSLIFAGCQKLTEDPKATITAVTYYNTAADLQAALSGVYEQYAYDGTWGFTNRMTTYFGADDLTTDPGLNKGPLREFDMLSGTSQNTGMDVYNTWKGIYQANNLLAVYQCAYTGVRSNIIQRANFNPRFNHLIHVAHLTLALTQEYVCALRVLVH